VNASGTRWTDEPAVEEYPVADLAYFISVIDNIAGSDYANADAELSLVSATQADDILCNCEILDRLTNHAPELVNGPLRLDSQFWIATGRPEYLPRKEALLRRDNFVDIRMSEKQIASAKPFNLGLFTCTGVFDTFGMWRIYLDMSNMESIYRYPWGTWKVTVSDGVAIREVGTAQDWVNLIQSYPVTSDSFLYPDWRKIAEEYDAVHLTLRAIAAIEGLPFGTPCGVIPRSFWGVESTLWLNWRFAAQSLCETVE
jgi:hypothetical protein